MVMKTKSTENMSRKFKVIYNLSITLIYVCSSWSLLISLISEYGNLWINYATIYSHFFLFPLIFMFFILLFLRHPTHDYITITKRELETNRRSFIKISAMSIGIPILFTFIALIIDFNKEFYAPWEIHPNENAQRDLESYDQLNHVRDYVKQNYPFTSERLPWIKATNWPLIFFYLNDVGNLLGRKELQLNGDVKEVEKQFKVDRDKLSRYLSTKNQEFYQKSATSRFYILMYAILILSCFYSLSLIVFFSSQSLAYEGSTSSRISLEKSKESFASLTAVMLCFAMWFPFRFSFLITQNNFLNDVSKAPDFLTFLSLIIGLTAISISWLYKHKEKVVGTITLVTTICGAIFSYLFPRYFTEIFTNIFTYVGISILMLFPIFAIKNYFYFRHKLAK